jgi:hypothetical protein
MADRLLFHLERYGNIYIELRREFISKKGEFID